MGSVLIDDILPLVEKPSRYLGREVNSVRKPDEAVQFRAAIVFPDLYEVGMSNLGTLLLYGLGNAVEGAAVERAFLPDLDMEALLAERGMPLFTLESRKPLCDCDLVGVTLQSELTYTNVLSVLAAGGVGLSAAARTAGPVVLGGGPCAFNPEPLADFFDLFFLGDAEEAWPEMMRIGVRVRRAGGGRGELLRALRGLEGMYDPRDFSVAYAPDGTVASVTGTATRPAVGRVAVPAIDYPVPPGACLVPFLPPVHDRFNLEVSRGCTRGCRFCAAGMLTRPVRERQASPALDEMRAAIARTGYEDIALTSLSIGDYGPLNEVLTDLMDAYAARRVSISLPSMRVGSLTPEVARQIGRVRRTGFTLAPEAGTERLRRVVNKDFPDGEILATIRWVFAHGWDAVKLYFMIGLPTETDEDLDGIVSLARAAAAEAPAGGRVTVNVSPFVPKPHTPFQWVGQLTEPELRRRLEKLQRNLHGRKIQVRWGRTDAAVLEAVLARGDRRLGPVIEAAWRAGARRDGWEEHFRPGAWKDALAANGLSDAFYASRERRPDEVFPWDHIQGGVDRRFLAAELARAIAGEVTPDCRRAGCQGCGACAPEQAAHLPALREPIPAEEGRPAPAAHATAPPVPDPSMRRIRLLFERVGDLRFIGHLEAMHAVERAARRGMVPLAFSGGYSPKPRMAFALSLPMGVEGLSELVDLDLSDTVAAADVMDALNRELPEGMRILSAYKTPLDGAALNSRVRAMTYEARFPSAEPRLADLVECLSSRESLTFSRERKGKVRSIDMRDFLLDIAAKDDRTVRFTLRLKGDEGSVRPQEVLELLLGRPVGHGEGIRVTRTALHLAAEEGRALSRPAMSRIWD